MLDERDVELVPVRTIAVLAPGGVSTGVTTLVDSALRDHGAKFLLARADALDPVIESDEATTHRAGDRDR